ncbi:MAG: hypothetical protein ACOYNI_09500 [Acidimicrobiia bacterium]
MSVPTPSLDVSATLRVLAQHPALWATAWRQARRMARPGWARRWPFLPLPDPAYLEFRLTTQYGRSGAPTPEDLVAYLAWCRREERATRELTETHGSRR